MPGYVRGQGRLTTSGVAREESRPVQPAHKQHKTEAAQTVIRDLGNDSLARYKEAQEEHRQRDDESVRAVNTRSPANQLSVPQKE